MLGKKQVKQLIDNIQMSRLFNGEEAKFIRSTNKYVICSNPFSECDEDKEKKVDINLWLSWPLWKYRHLNSSFHVGKDYVCELKDGTVDTLRYFGNGIFSKLTDEDIKFLNSSNTNYNNFSPKTYDLTALKSVSGLVIEPQD